MTHEVLLCKPLGFALPVLRTDASLNYGVKTTKTITEVSDLEIFNLYPGSYNSNCYVLIDTDSLGVKHAAVIDPSADSGDIIRFIEDKNAILDFILLTHGHFDHIMSLEMLRNRSNAPVYIHKNDAEMLSDGEKNAYKLFFGGDMVCRSADSLLSDRDIIKLGDREVSVISTPGHSMGSVCYLADDMLITGDTLFALGYGRCDLYGGDGKVLFASLLSLSKLDPELTIYPGHGNSEKLGNALKNIGII